MLVVGHFQRLFVHIWPVLTTAQSYSKTVRKISIQFMAPGFEITIFTQLVSSVYH